MAPTLLIREKPIHPKGNFTKYPLTRNSSLRYVSYLLPNYIRVNKTRHYSFINYYYKGSHLDHGLIIVPAIVEVLYARWRVCWYDAGDAAATGDGAGPGISRHLSSGQVGWA